MGVDASSPPGPLTVGEALRKGTAYLESKEREASRLSAELLLAHVLSTDRLHVYLRFDAPLEKAEIERLRELTARRGRGEPVAYLLGEKEFMGLSFAVNPSVLIPRPDTELLVQRVSEAVGSEGEAHVLDLGSGSGNIIVSLLRSCPHARGWAVDKSAAALEVTARNAQRHGVSDRLTLVQGDLFSGLDRTGKGDFDWLVSNPPYVRDDEWAGLAVEIREYEPLEALRGGPDGLAVYRPLIAGAPEWLKPGGRIALEMSPGTRDGVCALLRPAGFENIEVHEDLGRHPRLVVAKVGHSSFAPNVDRCEPGKAFEAAMDEQGMS